MPIELQQHDAERRQHDEEEAIERTHQRESHGNRVRREAPAAVEGNLCAGTECVAARNRVRKRRRNLRRGEGTAEAQPG